MNRHIHYKSYTKLLSLLVVCLCAMVGTTRIFAAEETTQELSISSEPTVKKGEEFVTTIDLISENEETVLTIDTADGYSLNSQKTQEENPDLIKEIRTEEQQIFIQLQQLTPKQRKQLSIYGSFSNEGEMKQQFYINGSKDDSQEYTWTVSTSDEEMDISSGDMPVSPSFIDVPKDFDWTKLNPDNLDLSGYTEQTANVPLKLTGGAFDTQQRNYYMFFGHVGKANTYNNDTDTFKTAGNMNAKIGPDNVAPIMSPMMIGTKKTSGTVSVFGYDYLYNPTTSADPALTAGDTASKFDIGKLDETGTTIIESNRADNIARYERIIKLYTKENEILAYGFVPQRDPSVTSDTNATYMPVRVHGYVTNLSEGVIRYDVSYLNETEEDNSYAMTYGLHVDIAGAHKDSKLYSNGEDGLYFNEPNATPGDGVPARLYFYLGEKRYPGVHGPTAFKIGNLGSNAQGTPETYIYNVATWQKNTIDHQSWLFGEAPSYQNPYGIWDPNGTKGQLYNLTHPIFAYRWDPLLVKAGEVGTGSFDMSIMEPSLEGIEAEKTYENLTSTDNKNRVGDNLQFKLTAKNTTGSVPWEQVTISDTIPSGLDIDPSSIQLINANGETIDLPESAYDPNSRVLKTEPLSIPQEKEVTLMFTAKINEEVAGKTMTNKMIAESDAEHSVQDEVTIDVEENPGGLFFVSAPSLMNFGQDLVISTKKQEYPIQSLEGDQLQVQDTRRESSAWKLTSKLLKEFTGTNGQVVSDMLHYRVPSRDDAIFSTNASIVIAEHKTANDQIVEVSQDWNGVTFGPVLVVAPGSVSADSYDAQVQWTLEDVPLNQ
ncbi:isopeptide-forming domain-containing fimbrial protein [Enterococcus faecium]|nr:isopeptide-forming domain-containing fimbrial protein [Enterococcus faecium]